MNNQFNFPNYKHKFTQGEGAFNGIGRGSKNDSIKDKKDEDLIIEENTIYEIDRDCVSKLKRNKKR